MNANYFGIDFFDVNSSISLKRKISVSHNSTDMFHNHFICDCDNHSFGVVL